MTSPLPVHGFVLAGGKSGRMGEDKSLLPFAGRPMVQIAVEKLRSFCADVSIAANRDDLAAYAPIVHESRPGQGPAAGVEAGLAASRHPWAVFLPVDVPLVPSELLEAWVAAVLARPGCSVSYLEVDAQPQPAFCVLHRHTLPSCTDALDHGERRLKRILHIAAQPSTALWICDAANLWPAPRDAASNLPHLFANLNTPQDLTAAEHLAATAASNQGRR